MAKKFVLVTRKDDFDFFDPQVHIRFGMVPLHKNLIGENDMCFGGGDFELDRDKKIAKLSGQSFDFGFPQFGRDFTKIYAEEDFEGWKFIYSDPGYKKGEEIDLTPLMEFTDP